MSEWVRVSCIRHFSPTKTWAWKIRASYRSMPSHHPEVEKKLLANVFGWIEKNRHRNAVLQRDWGKWIKPLVLLHSRRIISMQNIVKMMIAITIRIRRTWTKRKKICLCTHRMHGVMPSIFSQMKEFSRWKLPIRNEIARSLELKNEGKLYELNRFSTMRRRADAALVYIVYTHQTKNRWCWC